MVAAGRWPGFGAHRSGYLIRNFTCNIAFAWDDLEPASEST